MIVPSYRTQLIYLLSSHPTSNLRRMKCCRQTEPCLVPRCRIPYGTTLNCLPPYLVCDFSLPSSSTLLAVAHPSLTITYGGRWTVVLPHIFCSFNRALPIFVIQIRYTLYIARLISYILHRTLYTSLLSISFEFMVIVHAHSTTFQTGPRVGGCR